LGTYGHKPNMIYGPPDPNDKQDKLIIDRVESIIELKTELDEYVTQFFDENLDKVK